MSSQTNHFENIFVRRVLTEKISFLVFYGLRTFTPCVVKDYSKEEYIIIRGPYKGTIINKSVCVKGNETVQEYIC
jgi:hypothetical protein